MSLPVLGYKRHCGFHLAFSFSLFLSLSHSALPLGEVSCAIMSTTTKAHVAKKASDRSPALGPHDKEPPAPGKVRMTATPGIWNVNLIVTSWESLGQNHLAESLPVSWPSETVQDNNFYCFKLLNFGLHHYTTRDSWYAVWHLQVGCYLPKTLTCGNDFETGQGLHGECE